jgi:hypothetical protein
MSGQSQPIATGLVFGQALGEERERAERDGAEHVLRANGRLRPRGARGGRCQRTADDRELALGAHLVPGV